MAGDTAGEDEVSISETTEGTALRVGQMPKHSHGMVYYKKHNPGLLDLGGNTLEMRLRNNSDATQTTLTIPTGLGEKHDHLLNLTTWV